MQRSCIACGYPITYPIYHPEDQPLAALHLPKSRQEALDVLTYPMNFRACAACGHIFNIEFDYHRVPYEENSNLMYNRAAIWRRYMNELIDELVKTYDARNKTFIDIGCGDGGFLKLLIDRGLGNRCIGFEPGIEADNALKNGLEVYKDYFIPQKTLKRIPADFLVCRHVIEHLQQPREFVAEIAYWCNRYGVYPVFLAEVPRIDKAVEEARVNDYLYEHVSNFTELSFRALFETTGFEILDLRAVYDDEVVVAFVRPIPDKRMGEILDVSRRYVERIRNQKASVQASLEEILDRGERVAFWGGTGKGASFLNGFDIHADRFPIVVDSDDQKVGRFVPRTAQEIRSPDYLIEHPVDVIVITTQWRAKDIALEIRRREIPCHRILVLRDQRLQPVTEGLE